MDTISPTSTLVNLDFQIPQNKNLRKPTLILLMEKILHHLGCIKPCKSWIFTISTGAGFLPSTVLGDVHVFSLLNERFRTPESSKSQGS